MANTINLHSLETSSSIQKELVENQGGQVLVHEFGAADYEEDYDPYEDEVGSDLEEDFNLDAMEGVDDEPPPPLPSESILPSRGLHSLFPDANTGGVKRYYITPFDDTSKCFATKFKTPYEATKAAEKDSEFPTYPFIDMDEWQLAKWLGTSGLPQTQIDEYLKLLWVNLTIT
jgi:hypothetical protein